MKLSRLAALAFVSIAALAPASLTAKVSRPAASTAQTGEWKGFIAIDAATGKVLAEDGPDVVTPPASMTKLMTFAVLHDKLRSGSITLDSPVKIDSSDADMGGTQVFLDASETFPVEDLMYAMMIQSANDAAHALARFSAGSVEAFVDLMNAKARELGMAHTAFRSPHGLPPSSRRIADGDLTTPRDYAILCRYLLLKTDVLKYSSAKTRDFGFNRAKGPQHMENHNKLLGTVQGVDGLKTGYTRSAGYCLSATALRNGRRVIVVIMGAFGSGGRIDYGIARDRKAIDILDRGFAAIPASEPAFTGPTAPAPSPISAAPPASGSTDAGAPMVKFAIPGK
ncbi:MAG: serine hydrolase [Opitutaceae bacterium]|jgi:D-alanyl-D-alanine carboxypeptidase (penicillin-binding protein 5/6)